TSTSDTSDTSTSDTSDTSTSDTSDTSTSDTSDTSTSDTSDTSTSDDVTGDSLINELVKTGKFTEDEAKEFVSQNMLSSADTTSNSDDTSSNTNTDDTQATGTDDTQATSDSNNNGNPEDYDSLSELVDDIKNKVVDTDEISLSSFQNSGAYQGADEQTQDCIDLAAKIGSNLIDYEIVRCSEDPNHFKNQIANNDNSNEESSDDNNDNNNNESDDDAV
ncbi:MAG TPA: hypothetical protein VFR61_07390, partial [Nitrososphaeraceae archaeon]|nr:hypothetical protein [Nitrososphaeraceae archaeon]